MGKYIVRASVQVQYKFLIALVHADRDGCLVNNHVDRIYMHLLVSRRNTLLFFDIKTRIVPLLWIETGDFAYFAIRFR